MAKFRFTEEEWYPVIVPLGHPRSELSADLADEVDVPEDVEREYRAAFDRFVDAADRLWEQIPISDEREAAGGEE